MVPSFAPLSCPATSPVPCCSPAGGAAGPPVQPHSAQLRKGFLPCHCRNAQELPVLYFCCWGHADSLLGQEGSHCTPGLLRREAARLRALSPDAAPTASSFSMSTPKKKPAKTDTRSTTQNY